MAMVISPHADDAAAFCGATLAKFATQEWNVVLVRMTDDRIIPGRGCSDCDLSFW